MENKVTEAPLQDEGLKEDKETQDTLLTANQEENLSEDKADSDKNTTADDEEGKGDCPTEKDKGNVQLPKDSTLLGDGDQGDDQQQEPPVVEHDADSKKVEADLTDGAPESLTEESEDKPSVTPELTTENAAQDDEGNLESATESQELLPQESQTPEQTVPETIGPSLPVETRIISDVPPSSEENKRRKYWIAIAFVPLVVALISQQLLQPNKSSQKPDLCQIDIFHQEMGKLKVQFPSQREELWKRSRIHLQRHFQLTQPTEPVSIILTAGARAEGTLSCLAQNIASALSSALNASVLQLDGASKSSQDSDLVKSDIDSQLQKAFEGGKPIAVIHRFEELPPASTLIFYRYCDHENAAFKKTFLIFTVLLGEEEEIQANLRLSEVEEMVTDHLQKKFISDGHPAAFDKMDIDKYGGLWSRISHLILPVATEERIETTRQC